ncbi:phosphatidate cytidylyltransferase, partial [Streptomyces sp. HSW2009]
MNHSSWGAPPRAGHPGSTDQGPVPSLHGAMPSTSAGPVRETGDAAQTRPMPIVPDTGGDQDDQGAARLSGPLFRDEQDSAPSPPPPPRAAPPPPPPGGPAPPPPPPPP